MVKRAGFRTPHGESFAYLLMNFSTKKFIFVVYAFLYARKSVKIFQID